MARGEMSGHDLAREPGLGEQRDHRLGEMPLPVQPAPPLIGTKRQRDGPGPSNSVDSPRDRLSFVNDMEQDWFDDRSQPEVEFEPGAEQTHEQKISNLRVLEWLHDLPTDSKVTILTIQDVDKDGIKYVSHDNTESNWVAPDGPLRVPQSNLDLLDFGRSTGTSMDIFVRGVGVGLTHTENLIIKKLKFARETGELETEGKNAKKPPFGRIFESYFDLPNHYSNNIVITDSDFILTERTCAITITADVSFKTALAADFKREYKNIEFLWKQKPGVGGMIALPPVASQIPGKYLCFLVTKAGNT